MMNLVPFDDPDDALRAFLDIAGSKQGERKVRLLALRVRRLFRAYLLHRRELAELPRSKVYNGDLAWRERMRGSHAYRRATKKALHPASSFSAEARGDLLHCYEDETKALHALRAAILERQTPAAREICQHCCGVGVPDTWDHYIAKAHFPEFATFAPNLVPACWRCNLVKGERWIRFGKRLFVHFYYDRIAPGVRLVEATIDVRPGEDPEARFSLVRGRAASTRFGRLFSRHWRLLDLEDRLRRAANAKFGTIGADIAGFASLDLDAEGIQRELLAKANRLGRAYGMNHYEAVLYRAAAASRPLIEYCLQRA